MIYFTSDLHLCHNKDFIYEPRGFKSVLEMNEAILKNFTDTLTDEDELYILGDVMLNDNDAGVRYLKQIPGIKHIILGNHDTTARMELYKQIPQTDVVGYSTMFKYKKFQVLLSHYPTMTGNNDSYGVVYNLSGHTHSKDKFQNWQYGVYNVALDAHDCKPVSLEQIRNDIKEKINENR